MPSLVKIDGNPFGEEEISLEKVDGDPFGDVDTQPIEEQQDIPVSNTPLIKQMVGNIPSSAKKYMSDMLNFIAHPMTTAESLGQIIAGFTEKLAPGKQPDEWKADAMVQFFKDRYGSVEAAKQTAVEDPVGFLADVGTVATPVGGLMRRAGIANRMTRVGRVGEAIEKTGAMLEPVTSGLVLSKKLLGKIIPNAAAQKMYESAVKFSTKVTHQDRTKLVTTALENEILPNMKGMLKVENEIERINTEITKMIDTATADGTKIQLSDLMDNYKKTMDRVLKEEADGWYELPKVTAEYRKFYKSQKKIGRKELTPSEVQTLKKTIYKRLQSAYEKDGLSQISVEAKQAIANSMKRSLENIFPEIKHLNKRDGDLIELHKVLQQPVNRIRNRDISGIGVAMKSTMGATVLGSGFAMVGAPWEVGATTGSILGITLGVFDTPGVKSKLSLLVHKLQKNGIVINSNHALVRLGLVQLGRQSKPQKSWTSTHETINHIKE